MSNALAVASVTAVLKDLLDNAMIDKSAKIVGMPVKVSTYPPDRTQIENENSKNPQLNLFMYHVSPNPGWCNTGLPSRDGRGERMTNPPLALDLHYLLTAYAKQDFESEILLGYSMQLLHETPILTRDTIRKALNKFKFDMSILPHAMEALAASDLADQVELIKITPKPMTTEEMSKLWTAFQAKYRPSVAYHVSVVLIESRNIARSPLPVLTRGPLIRQNPNTDLWIERGIVVQPDLVPSYPGLQKAVPPNQQPAIQMGEVLTLIGHHLDGDVVKVYLRKSSSSSMLELPVSSASPTEIRSQIPRTLLFIWEEVLNGDHQKLKEFVRQEFNVDSTTITSSSNIITISSEAGEFSFERYNDNLIMKKDGNQIGEFTVKLENNKHNIYPLVYWDDQKPLSQWEPGIYCVSVVITKEGKERTTNEIPVVLAPRIDSIDSIESTDIGIGKLKIICSPKVAITQRVNLVIGDREIAARTFPSSTEDEKKAKVNEFEFDFKLGEIPSGWQHVRLRVDGIESIFIDRAGKFPAFLIGPTYEVEIP